jgi:hypothetical protein
MSNIYYNKLNLKEDDFVNIIIDNKINTDIIYKIIKFEYIEGNSFFDGFENLIYAYLEDIETKEIKKINIAYYSEMQRKTFLYAYKIGP